MVFKVPSVRLAQASPSVSLEKGSYRMRAPPSRIRSSKISTDPFTSASPSRGAGGSVSVFVPASYEKRMALLIALLACAMLASFGTAYHLWASSRPTARPWSPTS